MQQSKLLEGCVRDHSRRASSTTPASSGAAPVWPDFRRGDANTKLVECNQLLCGQKEERSEAAQDHCPGPQRRRYVRGPRYAPLASPHKSTHHCSKELVHRHSFSALSEQRKQLFPSRLVAVAVYCFFLNNLFQVLAIELLALLSDAAQPSHLSVCNKIAREKREQK